MKQLTDLHAGTVTEAPLPAAPAISGVAHGTPAGPILIRFHPGGLFFTRGEWAVGMPLADLLALAAAAEPRLIPAETATAKVANPSA